MSSPEEIKRILVELFDSQRYAVLATDREGQPHLSLVAFAGTADLRELFFATERLTAKYANLSNDPRVAMLIDNRLNRSSDTQDAVAVTVIARAEEIGEVELDRARSIYLKKHANLQEFVGRPSCALICLKVEMYRVAKGIDTLRLFPMGA